MTTTDARGTMGVERRSIDFVPHAERHGSPASLFTVWFAANTQITTTLTGALAIAIPPGLPLGWGVVALVVGNVVGGVFMALHSAQGPRLGVPQMIQSRAQFGFYGAILPLVLVVLMYLGFFASSGVLGGAALAGQVPIGTTLSIILISVVCTALAIVGYHWIHRYERWVSLLSGLAFLYLTVRLFTVDDVGAAWSFAAPDWGLFGLIVAIAATWQFTWGPYVADYSRYLPEKTSIPSTFWWTYGGAVIGGCWLMSFGAIAAAVSLEAFESGSVAFIVGLSHNGAHAVVAAVIILGVVAVNVLNLYGAFMSTTTTLTALVRRPVTPLVRVGYVLVAAVVGTVLAVLGRGNFVENYTNFILFLAYFLIPWSAINLIDFYSVRHEKYDVDSLFDPRGIYGAVNVRALVAYLVGIALELPFMNTTFYIGQLVDDLGGADIAWVIGFVVPAVLYYLFMRGQVAAQPTRTP